MSFWAWLTVFGPAHLNNLWLNKLEMMKGVERRGVSRREGQVRVGCEECLCVSWVRASCEPGEEGAADSHEGFIIKHTLLIGDNSLVSSTRSRLSMILLLFLPFPVVVSLPNSLSLFHAGFFFPFIFFDSDRSGTNTNWAKGPSSHGSLPLALSLSHCLSHSHTHHLLLFSLFLRMLHYWLKAKWTAQ